MSASALSDFRTYEWLFDDSDFSVFSREQVIRGVGERWARLTSDQCAIITIQRAEGLEPWLRN